MKTRSIAPILLALCALHPALGRVQAQGTAFTYQGQLQAGGAPVNGLYDFQIELFLDSAGQNQAGSTFLTNAVPVANGLFTLTPNFGSVFSGRNYWMQIGVRTNNAETYVTLNPLQAITPSPYAIFASAASNVDGMITSASLSGYGNAVTLSNANNSFSGNLSGDGGGLTNLQGVNLQFGCFTNALTASQSQLFIGGNTTNFTPSCTNSIYYSTLTNTICITNIQGLTANLNYFDLCLRNANPAATFYVWFATGLTAATSGPAAILNGGLTNMYPLTNSIGYYHFHFTCVGTNYLTNAIWEVSNPGQ